MNGNGVPILDRYDPEAPSAIEFRRLYSRLKYRMGEKPVFPLMMTSSKHEEGKTTTAAFLALTIARSEEGRVLLVDMDLHRPRIHRLYGLPMQGGVSEFLQGAEPFDRLPKSTPLPNLDILTSGRMVRSPSALFDPPLLRGFLEELSRRYPVVIIDSPPLLPVSDTMVLSTLVASILLVVMAGKTPREVVARGTEILRDVNAPLAGVVINNSRGVLPYYYNYKYYGYRRKE
ncbi:MAG: CpsD/CapB family tyrosine-protein kinase [Candidatus Eisenbacteria bacterium]|nr:CpsD/CapB family tyrosine-protein kinase [Candidatus Eisenbacteria bacterium]